MTFFADTPRALAASADGKTVYAAAFLSGSQTTTVADGDGGDVYPNGMPGPATITVGGQIFPQPAGACDLVARGNPFGRDAGFVFSNGTFVADDSRISPLSTDTLMATVQKDGVSLTFTAVPPGSGWRIGIDRDSDGFADGDEILAGSDPADPRSTP